MISLVVFLKKLFLAVKCLTVNAFNVTSVGKV